MKKVVIFIGSRQKRATLRAAQEFEKDIKVYGETDVEYIFLKDYRLDYCIGCNQCFTRGEDHCPLKDDRDLLLEKIYQADGVVFATPNYAFPCFGDDEEFSGPAGVYPSPAALFR